VRRLTGHDAAAQARILTVTGKRPVADRLIELVCEPADGAALPRWAPGAHVDLVLGPATARPYSLCGDPDDTRRWRFLVRRGRGGGVSAYLHNQLKVGDTGRARGPRDRFPLANAARYLFLASGAGIAPLLPMVARVRAARVYPWSLLLLERGTAAGSLREEIGSLGPAASIVGHFDSVPAAIAAALPGTAVQAAGSSRFVTAVETQAGRRGDLDLHLQRFDNPAADGTGGGSCDLILARQGGRVLVPAGTPLLRALLDAGVDVPWACGSGICGACVLPVLDGKIRHRDAVLTATERAAGQLVVTCVSTAATETLVLDV
jgi:ferredoxin-NADP reductase